MIERVAVFDDSEADREIAMLFLEAAGFEPVAAEPVSSLDQAIAQARAISDGVLSDHRLQWAGFAPFSGAELVSRCYALDMPAVLLTGFMSDIDTTIREYRRGIPIVLSRETLTPEAVRRAFEVVEAEASDQPPDWRIPRLALCRVERVHALTRQIEVVVSQWDPDQVVAMPASRLGSLETGDLRIVQDLRFVAEVNTGAEDSGQVFLENAQEAGRMPLDEEIEWPRS